MGFALLSPSPGFIILLSFLQTSLVCPVFESITVLVGRQLQVTVLAFSCLIITQCSMISAVAGGNWLRIGGGVAAVGCFLAAQPARSSQNTSASFLIPFLFARARPRVDGNLGYTFRRTPRTRAAMMHSFWSLTFLYGRGILPRADS